MALKVLKRLKRRTVRFGGKRARQIILTVSGKTVKIWCKIQKIIGSYRIIVKPDKYPDAGEKCYTALCPTLGLADYGDTIEQAIKNINSLIRFHIECLAKEGKEAPVDESQKELITSVEVTIPPHI